MDVWHRLDESGGVLLVLTSATCGACRAMRAALSDLTLPFDLDVVEVDAADARGLVEEHGTFHLPALYLYRDGELVAEVESAPRADAVAAALVRHWGSHR